MKSSKDLKLIAALKKVYQIAPEYFTPERIYECIPERGLSAADLIKFYEKEFEKDARQERINAVKTLMKTD